MILQALSETGIAPERTVMVGDTTFDMEMANNAKVEAIAVTWGHHEKDELAAHNPRFIIDQISELQGAIEASFKAVEI
jgi:phosphoglycolate phosphatase